MIRPDLSKWEYKQELEGLLIFAQSLDEMLFHHTIDTYKATALGVRTNILELRYLASQIKPNSKTIKMLEPIIEELQSRLRQDVLIKPKYTSVFSYYFQRIEQLKAKPGELVVLLNAFLSEVNIFYWDNLLLAIEEKVASPKAKGDIGSLANTFVVEAEFHNFSRSYIYRKTQDFFFKADVSPRKFNHHCKLKISYNTLF